MEVPSDWWGDYQLPQGTGGSWRIGPTVVKAQRLANEWRIATTKASDGDENRVDIQVPSAPEDLLALDTVVRFGTTGREDKLRLQPMLADRPVVTFPDKPFYVTPGNSVHVYVSTPIWLGMSPADSDRILEEVPLFRPSDTWFGPNTREGQLCYASRTHCRLVLDEVPSRPHRALTEVKVTNLGDTEFLLERMQLPVEHLELYQSKAGGLWTQDVTLERTSDDEPASLDVKRGPPAAARGQKRLAPARSRTEGRVLIRAFGALFLR